MEIVRIRLVNGARPNTTVVGLISQPLDAAEGVTVYFFSYFHRSSCDYFRNPKAWIALLCLFGQVVSINNIKSSSVSKGESLEDTIRYSDFVCSERGLPFLHAKLFFFMSFASTQNIRSNRFSDHLSAAQRTVRMFWSAVSICRHNWIASKRSLCLLKKDLMYQTDAQQMDMSLLLDVSVQFLHCCTVEPCRAIVTLLFFVILRYANHTLYFKHTRFESDILGIEEKRKRLYDKSRCPLVGQKIAYMLATRYRRHRPLQCAVCVGCSTISRKYANFHRKRILRTCFPTWIKTNFGTLKNS